MLPRLLAGALTLTLCGCTAKPRWITGPSEYAADFDRGIAHTVVYDGTPLVLRRPGADPTTGD
jgi:hypothetical protein